MRVHSRSLVYFSTSTRIVGSAPDVHVRMIASGLEEHGWKVKLVTVPQHSQHPGLFLRVVETVMANLRFAVAVRRSTMVYMRAHYGVLPGFELARVLGIPVVMELNGAPSDVRSAHGWARLLGSAATWVTTHLVQGSALVVCPTNGLERHIRHIAPENRTMVIPNGVDTDLFWPDTSRQPGSVSPRYVLFFGTFADWQGIPTMLAAVKSSYWPGDVTMVFAGDGAQGAIVREAATASDRVDYAGYVGKDELRRLISQAICTLSTQHLTGERASLGVSPLKVYESLACETPVIVSCDSEVSEMIIEGECGRCVPWGDPDEIAKAVAELTASTALARDMGVRGRELVVGGHTWNHRSAETGRLMAEYLQMHSE